jgi:hypothetical protein
MVVSAVIPTALATALDVNLSNISLVFITVTFATMVNLVSFKSSFLSSTNLHFLIKSTFLNRCYAV